MWQVGNAGSTYLGSANDERSLLKLQLWPDSLWREGYWPCLPAWQLRADLAVASTARGKWAAVQDLSSADQVYQGCAHEVDLLRFHYKALHRRVPKPRGL